MSQIWRQDWWPMTRLFPHKPSDPETISMSMNLTALRTLETRVQRNSFYMMPIADNPKHNAFPWRIPRGLLHPSFVSRWYQLSDMIPSPPDSYRAQEYFCLRPYQIRYLAPATTATARSSCPRQCRYCGGSYQQRLRQASLRGLPVGDKSHDSAFHWVRQRNWRMDKRWRHVPVQWRLAGRLDTKSQERTERCRFDHRVCSSSSDYRFSPYQYHSSKTVEFSTRSKSSAIVWRNRSWVLRSGQNVWNRAIFLQSLRWITSKIPWQWRLQSDSRFCTWNHALAWTAMCVMILLLNAKLSIFSVHTMFMILKSASDRGSHILYWKWTHSSHNLNGSSTSFDTSHSRTRWKITCYHWPRYRYRSRCEACAVWEVSKRRTGMKGFHIPPSPDWLVHCN